MNIFEKVSDSRPPKQLWKYKPTGHRSMGRGTGGVSLKAEQAASCLCHNGKKKSAQFIRI